MAISFVGSNTASATNGANVTLSLTAMLDAAGATATLAEGDVVFAAYSISGDASADAAMSASAGWTEITELFVGTGAQANLAVYYKVMGATPDTSVTFTGNAVSVSGTTAVGIALRGVDTTSPLDVTTTTATGTGTTAADPPANTPAASGSWLVVVGAAAAGVTTAYSTPADLSSVTNHFRSIKVVETADGVIGMGLKTNWTSGAFDPAVWSGASEGTSSWAAATLVVRPTPVGGKIKTWNGTAWVEKPLKVWNGTAWVEKPLKVWNGTAWVLS